jgi:cyanophycinase-like exopeptidase
MTQLPRLLVLIGSGETAAQMAGGHRLLAARLAGEGRRPGDVRAAVIDTTYGFQSNADALTAGLVDFFSRRVGMSTTVASLRRSDGDQLARETAFARIRQAEFVFAGPGSPSYAIRHWSDTPIPELFAEKLRGGGALVVASAAALTVGRLTVPIYEIYKAGDDPHWLPGLDVLATIGISAAVIPHYDNGEGGDHDTRFCFLGEQRLVALEEQMAGDVFVLGIDEHTAVILDLDTDRASVMGRGSLTVRRHGKSEVFAAGAELPLDQLRSVERPPASDPSPLPPPTAADRAPGLMMLEQSLDDLVGGARLVGPLVETVLEVRRAARMKGDFVTADAIRDRLLGLGIEISDASDGKTKFSLPRNGGRGRE